MADPAMLRETLLRMGDTAIGVLDIDIVRLRSDSDPTQLRQFLETGQALGARAVLVAADDPDMHRLADNFAALSDLAAPCGLTIDIEFMPWTTIPDLAAAQRLMAAVERPNAGILIDTLHVDRSGGRPADMKAVPKRFLHYLQICDAPAEQPPSMEAMIHCARSERLFPGEGGLDLLGMMRAAPTDIPVSIEVPKETLAHTVGPEARARMAIEATRDLLAGL
jgi:sugar phosphate isomerase/epimerase